MEVWGLQGICIQSTLKSPILLTWAIHMFTLLKRVHTIHTCSHSSHGHDAVRRPLDDEHPLASGAVGGVDGGHELVLGLKGD